MHQTESVSETKEAVCWAAPLLFGLLLLFIASGIMAVLIAGYTVRPDSPAIYAPLVIGSAGASLWGARRTACHRLLTGLLIGAMMLGCLFLLGWSVRSCPLVPQTAGVVSGVMMGASLAGSFCGAAGRKKKKRK